MANTIICGFKHISLCSVIAASFTVAAVALPLSDANAESFFKNKRGTVYIGTPPGGGYDAYGRTTARHLGRHIPGKPSVIPKNLPAASGLVLANNLYNKMPKDGTAMGVFPRGQITQPLYGNKQARFHGAKFNWLGSVNKDVSVCMIWHKAKAKTTKQFLSSGVIMGGGNAGASNTTNPLVLNNIVGANLKIVSGYPGGTDINLAMERGEVEARCGVSWSAVKARAGKWLKAKKIRIMMQMSTFKHPELAHVPLVMDYAKTDQERQALKLIYANGAFGRPFALPPGVPADRVALLRKAFMATMLDAKFLKEAKKRRLEVQAVSGMEVQNLIKEIYKTPADIIAAAKDAQRNTSKSRMSKANIPTVTSKGKITKIKRGGRKVSFKAGGKKFKASVSGRKTKVSIGGKKAKRSKLKVGMKCTFITRGSAAKKISCK